MPAGSESAKVQVQGHLKENWIQNLLFPLISGDKQFKQEFERTISNLLRGKQGGFLRLT